MLKRNEVGTNERRNATTLRKYFNNVYQDHWKNKLHIFHPSNCTLVYVSGGNNLK